MARLETVGTVLVALIGLLHVWILTLEMFLWRKPAGRRAFRMTAEKAEMTAVLAANQGLYNGFLAAGLFWSLLIADPAQAHSVKLFFLSCVAIAGVYGGITVGKKILFLQAGPALIAIACLCL